MFSDLTRERFRKFRKIRRSYYALLVLVTVFVLSLFSEFIANDNPLLLRYNGSTYYPALFFYPGTLFGSPYKTEANYKKLLTEPAFQQAGGWMLFPVVAWGPLKPDLTRTGAPPHPPAWDHPLGTDASGRDVFARLLYGFRISMLFSLALSFLSMLFGVIIGAIQGYAGGWVDLIGQRAIEIWSSLPFLYVVILLGSIYGRSFGLLVFVLAIFGWIGLSYYMRGEFLRLKDQTFVLAARVLGLGNTKIIFKHILPNALTPIITMLPFSVVGGIYSLTALDFLGFGLQPPTPSWGELLDQGLKNLQAPWLGLASVSALFITLMLAALVGEGIREVFDPKSKSRMM